MKKLIAMLAAATLLVSGLCSCGESGSKKKDKEKSSKTSHSDSKDKNSKDSDDDDDDDKESGKKDKNKDKDKDSDKDKDKDNDKDKNSSGKVSSSVSESDFVGKWELVKYVINGEDMSEYMTDDLPIYALGQLEIKDNGKAKMKTSYAYDDEIEEESTDIEWKMYDDSTAVFREADDNDDEDDDEEAFAVFEDDYLVMYDKDDEETKLYFEKVKSFHKIELPDVQDSTKPTTKPSVSGGSGVSTNSTDIAGKWECSEYKSGETDFDLSAMFGADISAIFKMEIGTDGKGRLYMFKGSENEESTDMEFTSIGNGKYSMIEGLDDDEYTVTVNGDTLTMSMATESLTFKRVTEFTETDWDKIYEDIMNQYGG